MKTLIGVIQSEANHDCQLEWIENLKELEGDYDVLVIENSFTDYKLLKHNAISIEKRRTALKERYRIKKEEILQLQKNETI